MARSTRGMTSRRVQQGPDEVKNVIDTADFFTSVPRAGGTAAAKAAAAQGADDRSKKLLALDYASKDLTSDSRVANIHAVQGALIAAAEATCIDVRR